MAYQKAVLDLKMKDVVLVKPSKSTPSCILSLSTLDNKISNNNICQTVHVYRPSPINDSNSNFNPCHNFKEALSKALFYYYPLAGRLLKHDEDGKLRIEINTSNVKFGVPVLEAIANCTLASLHYLDGIDTEIVKQLVLNFPSPQDKRYPSVFMVTKFLCGGFTIGMGVSHAVCDGFGVSQFFNAIVEFARGRTEPSVIPVWEREKLVGSITKQYSLEHTMINLESIAFSPFLNRIDTDIKLYCFKVEGEMITRLKLSLMKENENIKFTTFESLAGYVWRSRARALKLSNNGKTMLNMLVGIRRKGYNPLPEGYYGNSTMDGKLVLKVSELDEIPLYEIVKLIKNTINVSSTTDYVTNSINTYETINQEDDLSIELEATGAVTILTEWKHLVFVNNVDFGGYQIVNLLPVSCKMLGNVDSCSFMSPNKFDDHDPSMIGGVRIFTSLPDASMPKFRDEIEALRFF